MKNIFILSSIFLFILSCKTSSQLSTGANEPIDLSGRWNTTDTEIIIPQLIDKISSTELLMNIKETGTVYCLVNELNSQLPGLTNIEKEHFKGTLEASIKNLSERFKIIRKAKTKIADLSWHTELNIDQNVSNSDIIFYQLQLKIYSNDGELLWESEESIKKYLNN